MFWAFYSNIFEKTYVIDLLCTFFSLYESITCAKLLIYSVHFFGVFWRFERVAKSVEKKSAFFSRKSLI